MCQHKHYKNITYLCQYKQYKMFLKFSGLKLEIGRYLANKLL
jgi:hypothetical protein